MFRVTTKDDDFFFLKDHICRREIICFYVIFTLNGLWVFRMAKSPGGINPPARGTANWHWGAHLGTQRDASPLDKRLGGAFLIRTDHRLQGLPGSTSFFPSLRSQSSSGRRRPVYKIHDDLTEMWSPNFEHYQQRTKKSRDSGHHRLADPWCEYLRPQGPHR